jgi:poly(A) polymerase
MVSEIIPAHVDDMALVDAVARLVGLHMRPISYAPEWSDSAVRRLVEDAEEGRGPEGWADLLALARADLRGYLPEPIDRGLWVLDSLEARYRGLVDQERREAQAAAAEPRSPLDGRDLQALADLEPGPWIGELKEYLKSEVEAGRLGPGDRERAETMAREWLRAELKVEG